MCYYIIYILGKENQNMNKIKHIINIGAIAISALLALGACTIRTFDSSSKGESSNHVASSSENAPVSSEEITSQSSENKPVSSSDTPVSSSEAQPSSSAQPVSSSEQPSSSIEPSSSTQPSSSEEPVVTLVSIEAANNKESYEIGESLDLTVTAHYSDGTSMAINEFGVSGFNSQISGTQTVTVTYEDQSTTIDIFVKAPLVNLFPADALAEFLDDQAILMSIPSPVGYKEWQSSTSIDDEKMPMFSASTTDEGTVGVDSIKDTYYALLSTDTSWSIVAQASSYVAIKDNIKIEFTSAANKFNFYVHVLDLDPNSSVNFPLAQLTEFLQGEGTNLVPPAPNSEHRWHYETGTDANIGNYFYIVTDDKEGTPGVNAIEDVYKNTLDIAEWDIDDSSYSQDGYFATKEDVKINFYTAEAHFAFIAYKYEAPEQPITDEFGEWRLVSDASSLRDGDHIVIADQASLVAAGAFDTNKMKVVSGISFVENAIRVLPNTVTQFVLRQNGEYWMLKNGIGKLGASAERTMGLDIGYTDWTISISENNASITNYVANNGTIVYNSSLNIFTTYRSGFTGVRHLPQIYKFVELVPTYPTAISIVGTDDTIGVGKSTTLSINYTPADTNCNKSVTWSSSNPSVATVNANGVVTGVSEGVATITATGKNEANEDITATYVINVSAALKDAWTIMMYVCGSDLESENGFASSDIDEILSVSGQPDDVNIILETGGSSSWKNSNISASNLGRFHIENGALVKDTTVSKASMGKSSTLTSFLNWGLSTYPAQKTGVIFWNHGGGIDGVCSDENYNGDTLTSSETSAAFTSAFNTNGITGKLEFVGYDACLMQLQDVAEYNVPYFNYMVTSEETEAGTGWDYASWVDNLYAYDSTTNILKEICDGFIASVDALYGRSDNDQTLSVLDLSKMNDYYTAFENVASAISSTAKADLDNFKNLIATAKHYADSYIDREYYNYYVNTLHMPSSWFTYAGQGYYLVDGTWLYGQLDAYDVLTKIAADSSYSAHASLINTAKTALTNVVIYNKIGAAAGQSHGLALFAIMSKYCSDYPTSDTHFNSWRGIFK